MVLGQLVGGDDDLRDQFARLEVGVHLGLHPRQAVEIKEGNDPVALVRGDMHLSAERGQGNAMELAARLESHPCVARVRYPGLASHPQHALARQTLAGFGTIISFDLHGDAGTADTTCQNVRLIRHATSLGAVESTMERRAAIPGQRHLPPTLLRLSVGIEDVDDLWADLDQAMRSASG